MGQYKRGFGTKSEYDATRKRNLIWAQLNTYHGVTLQQIADKEHKAKSTVSEVIKRVKAHYGGKVPFDIRSRLPGYEKTETGVVLDDNIYDHWNEIDPTSSLDPSEALKIATAPDCKTQG